MVPELAGADRGRAFQHEAANADHKDQHTNHHGGDAQGFAQLVQAFLQRGLLFFNGLKHRGDHTELRVHAGTGNNTLAAAVGDRGAHKGRIVAVAQGDIGHQVAFGGLFGRYRFTGERSLFDAQVHRFQEAQVRGDMVASLHKNDVARNQLAARHALAVPVAQHLGFGRGHFLERGQRGLSAGFLHDAHHGIQDHDEQNGTGFNPIAQEGGDDRGANEQPDHKAVDLRPEHLQEGCALLFG